MSKYSKDCRICRAEQEAEIQKWRKQQQQDDLNTYLETVNRMEDEIRVLQTDNKQLQKDVFKAIRNYEEKAKQVEAAKTILKEYDNNFLFIPEEAIRQLKNLFEETTK